MGLFNKGTEKENLQGQQGKLQEKIGELQAKLAKIQNGLTIAETNELIDPTASNKKQVEKFNVAIEKTNGEIEDATKQAQGVASKIEAINAEERKAQIEEAGGAYSERVYKQHRINMLAQEVDRLNDYFQSKRGLVDPQELKALGGVKYNESLKAGELLEEAQKADQVGKAKAEKEMASLIAQIKEVFGL